MDLLWGEAQFSFGKVEHTTMFCAVQWRPLASLTSHTFCMTLLHTLYNEKVTNIVIHKSQSFMGAYSSLFECLQTVYGLSCKT